MANKKLNTTKVSKEVVSKAVEKTEEKPVVKTEVKPVEKAVTKTVEKPVKEAVENPVVKAEEKSAVKPVEKMPVKAASKVSAKKAVKKAELQSEVHVQFAGKSYSQEDLMKIAKDVWKYDLKQKVRSLTSVELYIKPEESMVYYVMNHEFTGSFFI